MKRQYGQTSSKNEENDAENKIENIKVPSLFANDFIQTEKNSPINISPLNTQLSTTKFEKKLSSIKIFKPINTPCREHFERKISSVSKTLFLKN